MSSDEIALIRCSQNGDVQAFNLLVKRFQQRLDALSYRMLRDAEAAADATQKALQYMSRWLVSTVALRSPRAVSPRRW